MKRVPRGAFDGTAAASGQQNHHRALQRQRKSVIQHLAAMTSLFYRLYPQVGRCKKVSERLEGFRRGP